MSLNKRKVGLAALLGVGALALAAGGLAAQGSRPGPAGTPAGEAARKPVLLAVPDRGIQPQVAVDARGTVHLVYFKGDPGGGDLFYARSRDGAQFAHPLR